MEQNWLPAIAGSASAKIDDAKVPELVKCSGPAARFAFDEFFYGAIRNEHTRKSYLHAWRLFSDWCCQQGIQLAHVAPGQVGRYLDGLNVAAPTRKVHLAALRRFFDLLVMRHVVLLNPALSVRTERYQVIEGKTPEIQIKDARRLLKKLDVKHPVRSRDRAIISVLIYTAARVGAVAKLRCRDFYQAGNDYCLRFHEKGGKVREIPVREDLLKALETYLDIAGLRYAEPLSPLFRSAERRTKRLTQNPMKADDMARMVKRRLRDVGLSTRLSPHSFRVTTITDLLEQGVDLQEVQNLAGHADPRTTRLYDRRRRRVTRNIVERISI
jgi:site-specific recombinase XerD